MGHGAVSGVVQAVDAESGRLVVVSQVRAWAAPQRAPSESALDTASWVRLIAPQAAGGVGDPGWEEALPAGRGLLPRAALSQGLASAF